MNYDDIKRWCHNEMRAQSDTEIYSRAKAILVAVEAASAPTWLSDAAEALGEVRRSDGAPLALNWTQVIAGIYELREERDHWRKRAEAAEYALAPYLNESGQIDPQSEALRRRPDQEPR